MTQPPLPFRSRPSHSAPQAAAGPGSKPHSRGNGDSWIGNHLINPSLGKMHVLPPADPKGRAGLMDTIQQHGVAQPKDDAWLGHILIDPGKGKAHPPGPEKRMGRKDLFPVFQQQALHDERIGGPAQRTKDPLADSWFGNRLIRPQDGKRFVQDVPATKTVMQGIVNEWSATPNNMAVQEELGPISKMMPKEDTPALAVTIPAILAHEGPYDEFGRPQIKQVPKPVRKEYVYGLNRKRRGFFFVLGGGCVCPAAF